MLKIGVKLKIIPSQCSAKIGTPGSGKGILKSVYRLPFKPKIKNYQYYAFSGKNVKKHFFAYDKRANSSNLDHYTVSSALDHN